MLRDEYVVYVRLQHVPVFGKRPQTGKHQALCLASFLDAVWACRLGHVPRQAFLGAS